MNKTCAHCNGSLQVEPDRPLLYCPFCGTAFESDASQPSSFMVALRQLNKPMDKYKLILETLEKKPDDFEANEALLYHGRLHEALSRGKLDYSAIPCYLLVILDKPEKYTLEAINQKFEELMNGAQLAKTMRLSPNPDVFFIGYLKRMAQEYISLFIQGDSQNSRTAFGFSKSRSSIAKSCAHAVRRMLQNLEAAPQLSGHQQGILKTAIIEGYSSLFAEYSDYLYEYKSD